MAEPPDIQANFPYAAQPDEVHLAEYWNIIVKHRRVVIIVLMIGIGLGTYFPFSATKLYTASSRSNRKIRKLPVLDLFNRLTAASLAANTTITRPNLLC
jgi:hypothetical protein